MRKIFSGVFLLSWLVAGSALAEPFQEMERARTAFGNGDLIETLSALRAAQEGVWREAPLGVRTVAFVNAPPKNFGAYSPKEGESFKPGESMILYCEPIGYTQENVGGLFRYSLGGAFEIYDSQGLKVGGQDGLGPFQSQDYRSFTTESILVMTIKIPQAPDGDYVLRLILKDEITPGKTVFLDKPFTISND